AAVGAGLLQLAGTDRGPVVALDHAVAVGQEALQRLRTDIDLLLRIEDQWRRVGDTELDRAGQCARYEIVDQHRIARWRRRLWFRLWFRLGYRFRFRR